MSCSWLISLFIVFISCKVTVTQDLKFVPSKDGDMDQKLSPSEPLTLLWGIADTTAYIGKLFSYTLPSDAFQGNVVQYDVST